MSESSGIPERQQGQEQTSRYSEAASTAWMNPQAGRTAGESAAPPPGGVAPDDGALPAEDVTELSVEDCLCDIQAASNALLARLREARNGAPAAGGDALAAQAAHRSVNHLSFSFQSWVWIQDLQGL